ncbi:hypothetical protein [Candidatus Korobacter versatilis]|uniref:hypothetical protein n=1 Tax=Candidatus Korobacter versatilis TaxID=658062 RepID=UPI0002E1FFD9|nr:hypothetical protein [Candidatus Koribacter versatilis]
MGLLIVALAGVAGAQKKAESPAELADEAAIRDYVLTMPKIEAFAAAQKEYSGGKADAAVAAEGKRLEADEKSSMLEKVKMIETTCPHLNAWIRQHGMTPREFMLTPMTLMTVGIAEYAKQKGGKLPDFISEANLQFYEQHKADLEKLGLGSGGGDSE